MDETTLKGEEILEKLCLVNALSHSINNGVSSTILLNYQIKVMV